MPELVLLRLWCSFAVHLSYFMPFFFKLAKCRRASYINYNNYLAFLITRQNSTLHCHFKLCSVLHLLKRDEEPNISGIWPLCVANKEKIHCLEGSKQVLKLLFGTTRNDDDIN